MKFFEERMSSYVDRGNALIKKGKTDKAMELMCEGFKYYAEKVIGAISPVSESDEGMVSAILFHIAYEIERNNPKAEKFREEITECMKFPEINFDGKVKKPNKK